MKKKQAELRIRLAELIELGVGALTEAATLRVISKELKISIDEVKRVFRNMSILNGIRSRKDYFKIELSSRKKTMEDLESFIVNELGEGIVETSNFEEEGYKNLLKCELTFLNYLSYHLIENKPSTQIFDLKRNLAKRLEVKSNLEALKMDIIIIATRYKLLYECISKKNKMEIKDSELFNEILSDVIVGNFRNNIKKGIYPPFIKEFREFLINKIMSGEIKYISNTIELNEFNGYSIFYNHRKNKNELLIKPKEIHSDFIESMKSTNEFRSVSNERLGKSLVKAGVICCHQKGSTQIKRTILKNKRRYFWAIDIEKFDIEGIVHKGHPESDNMS